VATTNLSSRDLRRANRATILRTLYFGGEMSRVNLSQQTQLSTATVTNVVAELLNEGSVIEVGSEESLGYSQRFGIVYVDYRTQARIPKQSAYWYGRIIRQNGVFF